MASMTEWPQRSNRDLAVLCSGGLDSAILLAEALPHYKSVTPIYVRVGNVWEVTEHDYLRRFLDAVRTDNLKPLVVLDQPVNDLYSQHWSMTGREVPVEGTPDEDSFLPGRNLLLFAKPLLWCLAHGIPELATAPLASNPFPDATPQFYASLAALASTAVSGNVTILHPYATLGLHKEQVLQRGRGFPLGLTFSCIRPERGLHCGACSKCGERKLGFKHANIADPTHYANR
jgi:7-cyano-7-deazaguanine synthase